MPETPPHTPLWSPVSRQILESSVWELPNSTRILWLTCLILAAEPDRRGRLDMTVTALARRARLPEGETRDALAILMAPDPESRSQEHEGRRLLPLDPGRAWGWEVANWHLYAVGRHRDGAAERQRRSRAARAAAPPTPPSGEGEGEREGVTPCHTLSRPPLDEVAALWTAESLRGDPERFWRWHNAYGWPPRDWREAARLWSQREREVLDADAGGAAEEWGKGRPPEAEPAS